MARFPFVVSKRKAVVIEAATLRNAVNKVLERYPNKFITTTFARNVENFLTNKHMDLISAQKEAKQRSKQVKNELVYLVLDDEGELTVKGSTEVDIDKDNIYETYRGGKLHEANHEEKEAEATEEKEVKTKTKTKSKNNMATTTKKNGKVATKKVAKKVAKKVEAKAKKSTEEKFPRGNNMFLTAAEWKKVDALLEKKGVSFSAFSRSLVLGEI